MISKREREREGGERQRFRKAERERVRKTKIERVRENKSETAS